MKLSAIATINAGYPFRGKIPHVVGADLVVVQMKDVSLSEGICWSGCLETELTGKRPPDYLTTGDILVAARGNHNYAVQVDQSLPLTEKKAVASPHFFLVRLKKETLKKGILPEFMVWLLNQTTAQRHFEQNAEGTLTKSIRRRVLEEVPVVVPPIEKQRTIISMANTLGEEKRLIQKLINNGESMMSAIASDLYLAQSD